MSPIRIHLGHMPAMLSAIIEDLLAREADLIVVGRTGAGEDPLLRAREEQADMLITSESAAGESPYLHALLSGPPLTVVAIARDGRHARAVSLAPQPIGEGETSLAATVRQAAELRT